MSILDITIIFFVIIESLNVIILYFFPDSNKGNGVAVFKPWQKAKEDEAMKLFAQYMAYWVAGTKLIFIVLLLVIFFIGSETTKAAGAIVMILSIATFFFKLNPIMHKLDDMNQLIPKGYSKKLLQMIYAFIIMFSIGVVTHHFIGA